MNTILNDIYDHLSELTYHGKNVSEDYEIHFNPSTLHKFLDHIRGYGAHIENRRDIIWVDFQYGRMKVINNPYMREGNFKIIKTPHIVQRHYREMSVFSPPMQHHRLYDRYKSNDPNDYVEVKLHTYSLMHTVKNYRMDSLLLISQDLEDHIICKVSGGSSDVIYINDELFNRYLFKDGVTEVTLKIACDRALSTINTNIRKNVRKALSENDRWLDKESIRESLSAVARDYLQPVISNAEIDWIDLQKDKKQI